ncbi:TetR/AcrR family transcriptional regulator [Rhizobium sullae]|uniref:TetR family transcriptional regulator n=1 Tax=Rhizobium sullae TaxID=50338 RepID=A0A4R3PS28_RHISU|nr:TetR family transcriptional regulator [Rhizobium sullae]TCU06090.1 TetR family transcriptional regulator [Rhizobium sullae]UWU19197.1 TetR family transcriptional regulator [Rhizobium sullae]
MNRRKIQKPNAKQEILDVSIRLFAERGLDAVSIRDITGAAGVNLGAVTYHFGSKEQLIHEIFEMLLGPLQEKRMELLDRVEEQTGDGPLDVELVLRAMIEPAITNSIGKKGIVTYLPRLMFQAYSVERPFLDNKLSEQSDAVARRFIDAIARAMPDMPYEQVCWRYYMVLGGLLQLTSDALGANRLWRLSGGLCKTDDPTGMIEELVAFSMRGLVGR